MNTPCPTSIEVTTFDTARRLMEADTFAELDQTFDEFAKHFGTERWTAVRISTGAGIEAALPIEFGRPPTEWQARFREQRYAYNDPATLQVLRSDVPFFLTDFVNDPHLTRQGRRIMGERAEFGLGEGVVCPIRLADGSAWALCCWAKAFDRKPGLAVGIGLAGQIYTSRVAAISIPRTAPTRGMLTPRMMQILELLRLGRTQTEVAELLGISVRTVENLLRDGRARLGVNTSSALIVKAISLGLIRGV